MTSWRLRAEIAEGELAVVRMQRDRYRCALLEICNLALTKTTDAGGVRDYNVRWHMNDVAAKALNPEPDGGEDKS